MVLVRVREPRARSREPRKTTGELRAESIQVVAPELIDGDEKNEGRRRLYSAARADLGGRPDSERQANKGEEQTSDWLPHHPIISPDPVGDENYGVKSPAP